MPGFIAVATGRSRRGECSSRRRTGGGRTRRRRCAWRTSSSRPGAVEVLNAISTSRTSSCSPTFNFGRGVHRMMRWMAPRVRDPEEAREPGRRRGISASSSPALTIAGLDKFQHRIADRQGPAAHPEWMAAEVIEDGAWTASEEGVPQRACGFAAARERRHSHDVFDQRPHQWRGRHAHGDVVIVRFADDLVVGFEHREDAERSGRPSRQARGVRSGAERREDAADRVWGGLAALDRQRRGGASASLDVPVLLGFTHICAKTEKGRLPSRSGLH